MKKILVTGSNGQLGRELHDIADTYKNFEFVWTDIHELDITNPGAINAFCTKHKFDLLINCAAYYYEITT